MKKKIISFLLSVLIIVSSFIVAFNVEVLADNVNLVNDGTFESGVSDWTQVYNNSGNKAAAFTVEGNSDTGYYLKGISGLSAFKEVSLKKGVKYTVAFDFKLSADIASQTYDSFFRAGFTSSIAAIGNSIFVGPNASGNKYYNIYGQQKKADDLCSWVHHSFNYTPSEDLQTYFVIGSYNDQTVSDFYVDNIYLCETSNEVTVTANSDGNGTVAGGKKTFKGDTVTLMASPNQGYAFDGWYDGDGQLVSSNAKYTISASDITLTAKFKQQSTPNELIGSGDFDDASLSGITVFKNTVSTDFSPVSDNEGYYMTGDAGLSMFKEVTLEANTEYIMSFRFKFETDNVPGQYNSFYRAGFATSVAAIGNSIFVGPNATGNKYYDIYAHQSVKTNWVSHSFTFTPTQNMTVYAVIGSYSKDAVAKFSVDDWTLTKSGGLLEATAKAENGGTATGTAKVVKGNQVTFKAVPDKGYTFSGWFKEGSNTPVSQSAEYTFNVTENITLIAKFEKEKWTPTSENYLFDGDFELDDKSTTFAALCTAGNEDKEILTNTYYWGRICSTVARMDVVTTENFDANDSEALNGKSYLKSGSSLSGDYLRSFGQFITLDPGDYVLYFTGKSNSNSPYVAVDYKGRPVANYKDALAVRNFSVSDSWVQYILPFKIETKGNYAISFGGNSNASGIEFAIDNVKVRKASDMIIVSALATTGGTVEAPFGPLEKGSQATVKAKPDNCYEFAGWYNNNTLVSADAEYKFTVENSVELTAMFIYKAENGNMLQNGNFENGDTLGWTVNKSNSENSVLVENDNAKLSKVANISGPGCSLYQQVFLKANVKYYVSFDFKFNSAEKIPADYNSFYRAGFVNNTSSLAGSNFFAPNAKSDNKYYNILAYQNSFGDCNKWATHSFTYTPEYDTICYFAIGCYNNQPLSDFSIDNITVMNLDDVISTNVVSVSHGGSGKAESSVTGIMSKGEKTVLSAVADKDSAFGGWYINGSLISTEASFEYQPQGNDVVCARFIDPKKPDGLQMNANADFSLGDMTGWKARSEASTKDSVEFIENDENSESYARIHIGDMLYQTVEIEPRSTYMMRINCRIPYLDKMSNRDFIRMGYSKLEDPTVFQKGSLTGDGIYTHKHPFTSDNSYKDSMDWHISTYNYSNNTDETMYVNVVIGICYAVSADEKQDYVDIKSFEFLKLGDGVSEFEPDEKYGECVYNVVPNGDFETPFTGSNWGAQMPDGWSVNSGHVETGDKFLTVKNSSKLYSFKVNKGASYLISAYMRCDKDGTSSISVLDAKGNVLKDAFGIVDTKADLKPVADGMWHRVAIKVYCSISSDGMIWLKINGGNNSLDIDDIVIVNDKFAHKNDYNSYGKVNNFDYDTTDYYNPLEFYDIEEKFSEVSEIEE